MDDIEAMIIRSIWSLYQSCQSQNRVQLSNAQTGKNFIGQELENKQTATTEITKKKQ